MAGIGGGMFLGIVLLSACAITRTTAGAGGSLPVVQLNPDVVSTNAGRTLKIMSVNLAHGRKEGPNQLLQKTSSIQENLADITDVLMREAPHIVAFQEADGPSAWSGNFDHVEALAESAGFSHAVRGDHVHGLKLCYGTGIASRMNISEANSHTFEPSPPTFCKGFVVATVDWPGIPAGGVDIVSLHLDFSRNKIRSRQAQRIIEELKDSPRPLIIMGDFNCEWGAGNPVNLIADGLGLKAYDPESTELTTFPFMGTRLDWVLVSPELHFTNYEVLEDPISDHRAVMAEVQWITPPSRDG
jgi:endonuclease/exonuclease/phosphatase family metal-dependent hydrolase